MAFTGLFLAGWALLVTPDELRGHASLTGASVQMEMSR
jgi:hypothetical protein